MFPKTREALIEHVDRGGAADFLFFWGHTPKQEGAVDASCLSQWFPRAFEHEGVRYRTAEHFMMAAKARLFADRDALARPQTGTPAEAKAIGRQVRGYENHAWERARSQAVVEGNVAKVRLARDLRAFLPGHGRARRRGGDPRIASGASAWAPRTRRPRSAALAGPETPPRLRADGARASEERITRRVKGASRAASTHF